MMKIVQTIKYFEPSKGGMESVAKNLVAGIKKNNPNFDVTVVCNNHEKNDKTIVENVLGVDVVRFKSFFYKSQPISFLFKGLKRILGEADVVNHHYPFPTMELALLKNIKILEKKNFIITWHANIQNSRWSWIENFYNPMIKRLLEAASTIIVTSPQLFEYSQILKPYQDKVEVIPLSFEPHNEIVSPKILTGKLKILFVGKLREYKGLKFLIEAVKNLDVSIDIVGNGEQEGELRTMINFTNQQEKIKLHTDVNDVELKNYYKNADVFVLPSINEAEAFGVVQLEALSYALPVINTNLKSGVPFVSLDNVTGFTVAPSNTIELEKAIEKLILNPTLYASFSKNALDRAIEFSNEKMVEKYLNVYAN
ncbi:glycosyltransferase [Chryseobacterium rhizosphaerae]|uniref:glycosyltransferase n=1 Tax=Chryseobacterium rhizosphaerae TaxID=395937 RepID=UPI0023590AB2|nr:glycosyltransferase [Chryseobacterium rhizosphaerae]MDC8098924.1 glycosyltransferase [Chryseobacterium rhizosphaerae]